MNELPWLVSRDFNEIMYVHEKKGGIPRDEKVIEFFRDTLAECGLFDVGYSGCWYTWERVNLLNSNIRERLDQGVANVNWLERFSNTVIWHLSHLYSNHCPLLVHLNHDQAYIVFRKFKF